MPVEGPTYPVHLLLAGRRCLVVGGGRVATGKVEGLLAAGAIVDVVAPDVDDRLVAAPAGESRAVTIHRRPYRDGEAATYRLVVTATGDPEVDRRVFLDAEAAGVWVNSADDPAHCSFTLPAVVRQGDITVTVATAGRSPAMAVWLRRRLEAELDPSYATLLDLVAEHREALREQGRATEGLSWQEALDSGMLELVKAGNVAEARERLHSWL